MHQQQENGADLDLPDDIRMSGPVMHRQDMLDPRISGHHLQSKSNPAPLSNVSQAPAEHEQGALGMQGHADPRKQSMTAHTKDGAAPPSSWTLAKSSPLFSQKAQHEAAAQEQAPANKDDSCTYPSNDDAVAWGHAPAQPPDMARLLDPASTSPPTGDGLDRARLLWHEALQSAQPSSPSHASKGLSTKSAQTQPTGGFGDKDVPDNANVMSAAASLPVTQTIAKESPEKIALAKQTFLAQIAKLKKENVRLEEENAGLKAENARLVLEHNTERANAVKLTSSWENEVAELVKAAEQFA